MRLANLLNSKIRLTEGLFATALCCLLVGRYVFSSVRILIGLDNGGSESSSAYSIAMGFLALVGLVFFAHKVVFRKRRISPQAIVALMAVLILALVLILTRNSYVSASNLFGYYLLFSVPSFLVGISVDVDGKYGLRALAKYFDLFMLLFSAAAITYQLINISVGWSSEAFAGVSYQMISYITALAFGLNLFSLAYPNNNRFGFTASLPWQILQFCLLPIQVICVFISGGRGGFVLTVVFAVVFALKFVKGKNRSVRFLVMVPMLALIVVVILLMVDSSYFSQLPGVERILSLRDNRTDTYSQAFKLLSENFIFGYGPGGYYQAMDEGVYCHNIFLDLILSFGFPLTMVLFLCVAVPATLTCRHLRKDLVASPLTVLAIYTFCHLFFSSTFLLDAGFWFFIGLVFNGLYQKQGAPNLIGAAVKRV